MNSALYSTQLAALVLIKLPEDYDVISKALRLQVTKNKLEFDDLSSLLIEEEAILIAQGKVRISGSTQNSGEALAAPVTKKGKSRRFKCGKRGHLARDCKSQDKTKNSKEKDKDTSKKGQQKDNSSTGDSASDSEDPNQAGVARVTPVRLPSF